MGTPSSVLAWRIPGTREPGGLPSMGPRRVRHDWSDLAAAQHFKWQCDTPPGTLAVSSNSQQSCPVPGEHPNAVRGYLFQTMGAGLCTWFATPTPWDNADVRDTAAGGAYARLEDSRSATCFCAEEVQGLTLSGESRTRGTGRELRRTGWEPLDTGDDGRALRFTYGRPDGGVTEAWWDLMVLCAALRPVGRGVFTLRDPPTVHLRCGHVKYVCYTLMEK